MCKCSQVSEHFVYPQKVIPTTADWRRDCSPSFFVCGRRGISRDSVAKRTTATTMQIHIGNLIRDELRRSGHTNQWLADRIGITPRTLQKLFNKPSVDTQQLLTISRALGADLFSYYSMSLKESPYNSRE